MFSGVRKTRLDITTVWTPDIFLHEDVSVDMATGPDKFKTQVVINYDGTNSWYIPTLFESSCIFNVASFPFDKQSCTLVFTPWTHDKTEVDLIVGRELKILVFPHQHPHIAFKEQAFSKLKIETIKIEPPELKQDRIAFRLLPLISSFF